VDVIVETDLGCDPDDLFALLYLHSAGVNIRMITITPGDPDQIAVGKFLTSELGLDIPVCASRPKRHKLSTTAFHAQLLEHFGYQTRVRADAFGSDAICEVFSQHPDCQVFICGPPSAVGGFLKRQPEQTIQRAVIQGGFIGYDVHALPCRRLSKFEGKNAMPTFNLNGAPDGARRLLEAPIRERSFVPKDVCHTISYTQHVHEQVCATTPRNRAGKVFRDAMDIYRSRKSRSGRPKKLHDPAAAVALLHPEVFTWVRAKLYKRSGEWGAVLDPEGDMLAVDIDRDRFWEHIAHGT